MYEYPLLASLLVAVAYAEFLPGCSFNNGQCMYTVQLGHQGQCDSRAVTSGDGNCCDAVQSQVTGLTSDVNTLKSQVSILMSELGNSKNNLSEVTNQLSAAEQQTQNLLQTLAQKEAEFNTSQAELAKVLGNAEDEIRSMRQTISLLTTELNACKVSQGLATTQPVIPDTDVLTSGVMLDFCNFEQNVTCGHYLNTTDDFQLGSGMESEYSGPVQDHTLGSPRGHYMFMDARNVGAHNSYRGRASKVSMTSREYPPAAGYCVRFWYSMYGHDVRNFSVYARVDYGNGYPVFHREGNHVRTWLFGEVDLDREYTSHPFQVVFSATTTSYRSGYVYEYKANVAVDDIYVYNTSCKNIPKCPRNGITWQSGSTTHCYTFHTQPATWFEAASLCRGEGATTSLVTVKSQEEQNFLVQTIKHDTVLSSAGQNGFFTAGSDQREEHTFDWTDTGTPYQGTYTNWKTGQPNNVGGGQDCLLLEYPDLDYQWGDVDCSERHPFICKTSYPTPHSDATTSGTPMVG